MEQEVPIKTPHYRLHTPQQPSLHSRTPHFHKSSVRNSTSAARTALPPTERILTPLAGLPSYLQRIRSEEGLDLEEEEDVSPPSATNPLPEQAPPLQPQPVSILPVPPLPPLPASRLPTPSPPAMSHIVTFEGRHYGMSLPEHSIDLVSARSTVMATQAASIQALQMTNPNAQNNQRQVNPVLSTATTRVYLEEHQVPVGMEDIKGFPTPAAFTGQKTDAEPSMVCPKAYFAAKPKASKFTKNRILLTLSLLKKNPRSATWAKLVERAIANGINDQYYFDNWDRFQAEFLKHFGLTNSKQHYFNKMTQCQQGKNDDCTAFCDAFE